MTDEKADSQVAQVAQAAQANGIDRVRREVGRLIGEAAATGSVHGVFGRWITDAVAACGSGKVRTMIQAALPLAVQQRLPGSGTRGFRRMAAQAQAYLLAVGAITRREAAAARDVSGGGVSAWEGGPQVLLLAGSCMVVLSHERLTGMASLTCPSLRDITPGTVLGVAGGAESVVDVRSPAEAFCRDNPDSFSAAVRVERLRGLLTAEEAAAAVRRPFCVPVVADGVSYDPNVVGGADVLSWERGERLPPDALRERFLRRLRDAVYQELRSRLPEPPPEASPSARPAYDDVLRLMAACGVGGTPAVVVGVEVRSAEGVGAGLAVGEALRAAWREVDRRSGRASDPRDGFRPWWMVMRADTARRLARLVGGGAPSGCPIDDASAAFLPLGLPRVHVREQVPATGVLICRDGESAAAYVRLGVA